MHSRQVVMSSQLLIALVQALGFPSVSNPRSKLGHEPMSQPIVSIASSSPPTPQSLSAPPHDLSMVEASFVEALLIDSAASTWQSVTSGSLPLTFASSHLPRAFVF